MGHIEAELPQEGFLRVKPTLYPKGQGPPSKPNFPSLDLSAPAVVMTYDQLMNFGLKTQIFETY